MTRSEIDCYPLIGKFQKNCLLKVKLPGILIFAGAISFSSVSYSQQSKQGILTKGNTTRQAKGAGKERPNIILIMADDMGYSDLGCYGSEINTPNLDKLAANGIRFTQFYNAARCCPTRASLLTGLYPHQTGVGHMTNDLFNYAKEGYQGNLNRKCMTIAEVLKWSGYNTFMAGKWHLGKHPGMWPCDRGFEEYYGIIEGSSGYFKVNPGRLLSRNNTPADTLVPADFYLTDAFSDSAINFIDKYNDKQKPFFLYLAYNAPHWPLQAKMEDIRKYEGKYRIGWDKIREQRYLRQIEMGMWNKPITLSPKIDNLLKPGSGQPLWETVASNEKNIAELDLTMAIYAAMIDRMDQGIGRLINYLEKKNIIENTLILFLSDNGACHEGGTNGAGFPGKDLDKMKNGNWVTLGANWAKVSNTPFRFYKSWAHEGGISTPLVAHWPKVIQQKGVFANQPEHIIDIMATVIDITGAKYPSTYQGDSIRPIEGKSLLPVFQGKMREGHNYLCWSHEGNRAIRKGKWKLAAVQDGEWELYDIENDRSECNNKANQFPEVVEEMDKTWEKWRQRTFVEKEYKNEYWKNMGKSSREYFDRLKELREEYFNRDITVKSLLKILP
jgi:arylsulfatase